MFEKFSNILDKLEELIFEQSSNSEIKNPNLPIKAIEAKILIEHKKSNYLPKIEQPPSM